MIDFFLNAYKNAPLYQIIIEAIVFVFGIASVLYAKKENILVYPTGLLATLLSTFLLWKAGYLGDMMINLIIRVSSGK